MAQEQLFYAGITVDNFVSNGANDFIRVRFDADITSTTLSNVQNQSGYLGIGEIIPGQQLVASTQFPTGTTIVSVSIGSQEIVVSDFPAASGTNRLARVSPPKGQYFVSSGSLSKPNGSTITTNDITGSEDTQFNPSDNKFGVLLTQVFTSSISTALEGNLAQYEISRVIDRQNTEELSFYITSSTDGILSEEPDKVPLPTIEAFVLVELSYSSSLAPIFNQNVASAPPGGFDAAAYQIAINSWLDSVELDILYTGSYVKGNTQFINFTGSGIQDISVTESFGRTGVNITVQGGGAGGDSDWYDGNTFLTSSKEVRITGSLLVTHTASNLDFFVVNSGSYEAFKINSEGITQFFAYADAPTPWATADYGGLYFQSSSVWAALD
tara:strand:- start:231 stop:1379 length:1149 start_codon:yes stop_codon:yes gene_type:complete